MGTDRGVRVGMRDGGMCGVGLRGGACEDASSADACESACEDDGCEDDADACKGVGEDNGRGNARFGDCEECDLCLSSLLSDDNNNAACGGENDGRDCDAKEDAGDDDLRSGECVNIFDDGRDDFFNGWFVIKYLHIT